MSTTADTPLQRVIVYVDGFNLYYGMKSKGWRRYYWLDIRKLAKSLLTPSQRLARAKYFTSLVSSTRSDPDKSRRQNVYLEALQTLPEFDILFGHYLDKPARCVRCGSRWRTREEKMTDVNIAVSLMTDAFQDRLDTAIIISGDSDLVPPVLAVRSLFPQKRVVVAFPPARSSNHLARTATASFVIGRRKLGASQFPDQVPTPSGHCARRPASWR